MFMREVSSAALYKRAQGRLTRQLTFIAIVVMTAFACYSLSQSWLSYYDRPIQVGIPIAIAAAISWLAFRAVNFAPFAEFLITVQAEVAKVNWPSKNELKNATIVVIVAMFMLGIVLYIYDFIWYAILHAIGVLSV